MRAVLSTYSASSTWREGVGMSFTFRLNSRGRGAGLSVGTFEHFEFSGCLKKFRNCQCREMAAPLACLIK
jgi:hypothetical protein